MSTTETLSFLAHQARASCGRVAPISSATFFTLSTLLSFSSTKELFLSPWQKKNGAQYSTSRSTSALTKSKRFPTAVPDAVQRDREFWDVQQQICNRRGNSLVAIPEKYCRVQAHCRWSAVLCILTRSTFLGAKRLGLLHIPTLAWYCLLDISLRLDGILQGHYLLSICQSIIRLQGDSKLLCQAHGHSRREAQSLALPTHIHLH